MKNLKNVFDLVELTFLFRKGSKLKVTFLSTWKVEINRFNTRC